MSTENGNVLALVSTSTVAIDLVKGTITIEAPIRTDKSVTAGGNLILAQSGGYQIAGKLVGIPADHPEYGHFSGGDAKYSFDCSLSADKSPQAKVQAKRMQNAVTSKVVVARDETIVGLNNRIDGLLTRLSELTTENTVLKSGNALSVS